MKKWIQAAAFAGGTTLVGCGDAPPEDTQPATQEQREDVREVLERIPYVTPMGKRILKAAKPKKGAFDRYGKDADNFNDLAQSFDDGETDLWWLYENDRIVTQPIEGSTRIAGYAGGGTKNIDNDWLIVSRDSQGRVVGFTVGVAEHEIQHRYLKESRDHNEIQEKIKEGDYSGVKNYTMENNDSSYMSDLVLMADTILEQLAQKEQYQLMLETMPEDVEQMIGNAEGDETSARHHVQNLYVIFSKIVDKTDEELAQEKEAWFMEIGSEYNFLGVSPEQFREIYYKSPELQQYQKDTAYELRSELTEMFPEWTAELQSEKDQELDEETGQELDQEGDSEAGSELNEEPEFWREYAEGDEANNHQRESEPPSEGPKRVW